MFELLAVPTCVSSAINAKLDKALADCPEAEKDRDHLYHQLLVYFDEHGELPEFTIERNNESTERSES